MSEWETVIGLEVHVELSTRRVTAKAGGLADVLTIGAEVADSRIPTADLAERIMGYIIAHSSREGLEYA